MKMKMKVKELIEKLSEQDPDKDVLIQQGQEFGYMTVYTVKPKQLIDPDTLEEIDAVVIEYN
jgi:hypothetical protein